MGMAERGKMSVVKKVVWNKNLTLQKVPGERHELYRLGKL